MFFQQKKAVILEHDIDTRSSIYKQLWKQITIPKSFQNNLGVENGDIVIIRENMLSTTIACIICGEGPQKDVGNQVIRVNEETRKRIKLNIGNTVLIEKFDVLPADEIQVEWYHTTPKKFLEINTRNEITELLKGVIFQELADLPLMEKDRFSVQLPVPSDPEVSYKIVYWIRSTKPKFPVVRLKTNTILKIF